MFEKIRLSVASLFILLFSMLAGCDDPASELADDDYDQSVSSAQVAGGGADFGWQVSYKYFCDIEIEADGSVHIYGRPYRDRLNDKSYLPKVKVMGKARFVAHNCAIVKVDNGAVLEAHSCPLVKANPGAKVEAYNCSVVRAAHGAKVQAHGDTVVEPVAMPVPEETQIK
ncbi:MAG: hypothetical protein K2X27_24320 [Candidatus Obscuribacterales bacterium]|nr:hypothetical protein [Candidatus Obscuribacterales bacterium]